MARVLMISPMVPDANGSGTPRRAHNILDALASEHSLDLLVVTHSTEDITLTDDVSSRCGHSKGLVVRPAPAAQTGKLPGSAVLAEIFHPSRDRWLPDRQQLEEVAAFVEGGHYDLVFCFRIRAARILREAERLRGTSPGYRRLVDFDDIESLALTREYRNKKSEVGPEYTLVQWLRARRLRALERYLLTHYDGVYLCSEHDRERVTAIGRGASLQVLPNCVALPAASAMEHEGDRLRILFVGTMAYLPNSDGITWFVEHIFPTLKEAVRTPVELYIVGFKPTPAILAYGEQEGVTVTGGVDSVEPYYRMANLVVAPIRFGGGTRIKILEAFSFERAVVATTMGAEGIDATDGCQLFLADTPEAFAGRCREALLDPALRKKMGVRARALVATKYTPAAFARSVLALC